jgi:nucleotidyltransferase-like protein
MNETQKYQAVSPPDAFLAELVQELDNEDIVGITLGGSYARGEATQYSDVDLACFWREGMRPPPKRFFYRGGKLISVKMTSVAEIQGMLARPQAALLFASGKHRLLLDKDGSVARLLQEIEDFRWEALEPAANWSINIWMMLKAEDVHKVLRELQQGNESGLAYAVIKLISELTLLVAMRYGILITSDSTYYRQVEEAAGSDSAWTHFHRIAIGLEPGPERIEPIRARGIAALRFYRETLEVLRPVMSGEYLEVVEQAVKIVDEAVEQLPFTDEEYRWLKK